jgi:type VI secretion system ImpC/EvpB family protein
MRLLLLGDFSGLPAVQRPPLAQRPTQRVDNDNLDACMRALGVGLQLGDVRLGLAALDDFHPDSLLASLPAAAATEAPGPAASAAAEAADGGRADLLAQLLGGGATAAPAPGPVAPAGLDNFIRQIVAPHVVPGTTATEAAAQATADADLAARLRALLHAPAFQALEANWRGVHWLLSALELNEELQLHLFDLTRDELLDDLVAAGGQVAQTQLFQALVQRGRDQPDGAGWSALVGLWSFGASVQHIGLLAGLGHLAAQAGAPLLAGADLALAGEDGAALAGWQALRRSAVAPWIGLAAPGLLLRQPYGPRSDPVQAFAFEEFAGGVPQPALCLWGSAALAPALLLGRAYSASGWDFRPGDEPQIDGLPAVSWRQDGEAQLLPVAWPALDEAAVQRLQQAGLMPLWAHRQQPMLRLACWQSVRMDGQSLAGLPAG